MKYLISLLLLLLVACNGGKKATGGDDNVTDDSTGVALSSSGTVGGDSTVVAPSSDSNPGGGGGGEIPALSSSSAGNPVSTGPFGLAFVDSSNGHQYISGVLRAESEITAFEVKVERDGVLTGISTKPEQTLTKWKQRNPSNPYTEIPLTGDNSLGLSVNFFEYIDMCNGTYSFIVTIQQAVGASIADTAVSEQKGWGACK